MPLSSSQLATLNIAITPWIGNTADEEIVKTFNLPGSASSQVWIMSAEAKFISKGQLFTVLGNTEIAALDTFINTSTSVLAKVLRLTLFNVGEYDMADLRIRQAVDGLVLYNIISSTSADKIKKLGESLMSKSEEVVGRKITLTDVIAARSL